jgi:hypothetical protein
MTAMKMTVYPSVRKPARNTPESIELEFARDSRARGVIQRHSTHDEPGWWR